MPIGHENWREQGGLYAVGALEGEEIHGFEAHLASGCALCEACVRETRESLLALHRAVARFEPPPAVKTRVLDQIANEQKSTPIGAARKKGKIGWQRMAGTIAAAFTGVVITAAFYHYRYEPRPSAEGAVIDLLRDPTTRSVSLYGAGPTPAALGRCLWNKSGGGHLLVTNLPAAPQGKMYAVWIIAGESAPRYVGSIGTDSSGRGGVHINVGSNENPVQTFAVTLERLGATAAPTGPVVLASKPS